MKLFQKEYESCFKTQDDLSATKRLEKSKIRYRYAMIEYDWLEQAMRLDPYVNEIVSEWRYTNGTVNDLLSMLAEFLYKKNRELMDELINHINPPPIIIKDGVEVLGVEEDKDCMRDKYVAYDATYGSYEPFMTFEDAKK